MKSSLLFFQILFVSSLMFGSTGYISEMRLALAELKQMWIAGQVAWPQNFTQAEVRQAFENLETYRKVVNQMTEYPDQSGSSDIHILRMCQVNVMGYEKTIATQDRASQLMMLRSLEMCLLSQVGKPSFN